MTTLLIVFATMLLFVVAMAVGVLMGRKPVSGSCGGMAAIGMEKACDVCGGDKQKCEKENSRQINKGVTEFYDATND